MGTVAENLTHQELIAAVHAIERAAGQSVFSPEYQAGIRELLDRAADEGAADPERCRKLAQATELAIPNPGQEGRDETLENVEIYGLSVLDGFLRGRDTDRPLVLVSWTTPLSDGFTHPEWIAAFAGTEDGPAPGLSARSAKPDHPSLWKTFQVIRENASFWPSTLDGEEFEKRIWDRWVQVLGERLRGEAPPVELHLVEDGLGPLVELATQGPLDVILFPAFHSFDRLPPPVFDICREYARSLRRG